MLTDGISIGQFAIIKLLNYLQNTETDENSNVVCLLLE